MRFRGHRIRRGAAVGGLLAGLGVPAAAAASADVGGQLRTLTYHGYTVTIPRSWPVFNLGRSPHTCVRFDRHALYLGTPSGEQNCPAQAVGRTEAILIEPRSAMTARAAADEPLTGSATTFAVARSGVEVTATWQSNRALIEAALHRRTLPEALPPRPLPEARASRLEPRSSGGGAPGPTATGVYNGPGFDVCDVPSSQQMSAWTAHSPYHAIGVYIGGENAACPPAADPNLTTTWLTNEAGAGWHFIPTYVGLQAPSGCCKGMSKNPTQASTQGTADADQAVADAQSLNLPSGTPIYDDMEYYSRTPTNTAAVLAFLSAWTTEIHAKGYVSGVYGNSDSVMADLVTQYGTTYPEPDDIWFAAWPGDGSQSTNDPDIPAADWENGQRLHQYSGGHNETYGGVTLDIDGDYLDGATAGAVAALPPSLAVSPTSSGVTNLTASWSGLGLTRWEVQAGVNAGALTNVRSVPLRGEKTSFTVRSAAPYFAVQAVGSSNQILATSVPVAAPPRLELFGHSSFVGEGTEVGTVPVGCYLASPCRIVATIYAGHTRVARSAPASLRSGGSGLVYYRLNWAGLRLLAKRHDAKLPVQITLTDASGASAGAGMSLIPFSTSGSSPPTRRTAGSMVGATGTTDFVHGGSGGILVRCGTVSACWISATLTAGRTKLASTRPQPVGGMELGYVFFALTSQGRQLLSQDPGNQLGVNLVLHGGTSTARGRLALVQY